MDGRRKSRGIYAEAVNKVLQSEMFGNAAALRQLLSFLSDKTFAGEAENLKEFTIGVEALGRPAGYDTQSDPSVRVQVGRLRRKLVEYYEGEGAADPIRVHVPKGQFALEFTHSDGTASGSTPLYSVSNPSEVRKWQALSLVSLALVVALAYALFQQSEQPSVALASSHSEFTSAMNTFWQPYLDNDLPTVLSLGVAMFVRIPAGVDSQTTYMRQSGINSWPPASEIPGLSELEDLFGPVSESHPVYNYCGVGEAIGSYLLGKNLEAGGLDVPIVRSTFLTWDTVKASNMIFVGPPKFNPHITTGEFEGNFRIVEGGVKNVDPLPGEPSFYGVEDVLGRPIMAHAVISRFHNGKRPGAVTVFSSNDGTGTWAAVEHLTRPDLAQELVDHLRRPDGTIPESFEVVVRARCDEDYPLEIEYVTHREY